MKLLVSLATFLSLASAECTSITKAEDITYDFLLQTGEETGQCDHIPVFKMIFETIKVRTLLEFGLGYSTKYFLDNATKVISVEFISSAWGSEWMKNCLTLYKNYSNWVPVSYFTHYKGDYSWAPYKFFGSEVLFKAINYSTTTGQPYASTDPTYSTELQTFITNLSKYNKIDVALVDPGHCMRSELVQLLFGKVSLIVTTDMGSTEAGFDPYGFKNLQTPEDYEPIYIPTVKGTMVWMKKTDAFATLAQKLKDYAR